MTVAVMHPRIKRRRVKNVEQIKMPVVVSLPAAARLPISPVVAHHTRAVEPDFKKSNKKSDAQGACRRLYPTFA